MENRIIELEREVERLQYENQLKTGLISVLSHDSRGIFGNFIWIIDALEQKMISQEDFFTLLPQVKSDAQKNLQTTQDITEWLKAQYGKLAVDTEEIHLSEVFNSLKEEFKDLLKAKEISFEFEGDSNQTIHSDMFLIRFILNKILDNAIKYSSHGQNVTMQFSKVEDKDVISINDLGMGISEKNLNNLFSFDNPVFQGTNGELGAGLGLKIVENFVLLLSGNIKVVSSINKGTTVSVLLPQILKDE